MVIAMLLWMEAHHGQGDEEEEEKEEERQRCSSAQSCNTCSSDMGWVVSQGKLPGQDQAAHKPDGHSQVHGTM